VGGTAAFSGSDDARQQGAGTSETRIPAAKDAAGENGAALKATARRGRKWDGRCAPAEMKMKVLSEYLAKARRFARLQRETHDRSFQAELKKQELAYMELAEMRAKKLWLAATKTKFFSHRS
jgi:hypothetical protein